MDRVSAQGSLGYSIRLCFLAVFCFSLCRRIPQALSHSMRCLMLCVSPFHRPIGLRALDVVTIGHTVAASRAAVSLSACSVIGSVFTEGTIGAVGAVHISPEQKRGANPA